jgi:hypothetical protein
LLRHFIVFLSNPVAQRRTLPIEWPAPFEKTILLAYMDDLNDAYKMKIAYGSARGLGQLWRDFQKEIREKIESQKTAIKKAQAEKRSTKELIANFPAKISPGLLKENLDVVNASVNFKEEGDFMDVEALHYIAVGRFEGYSTQAVLFATQDRIDDILIRISLFKSLHTSAYQWSIGDDSAVAPGSPGVALQYNDAVELKYLVQVDKVEPLLNIIGNVKMKRWLIEKRNLFKT